VTCNLICLEVAVCSGVEQILCNIFCCRQIAELLIRETCVYQSHCGYTGKEKNSCPRKESNLAPPVPMLTELSRHLHPCALSQFISTPLIYVCAIFVASYITSINHLWVTNGSRSIETWDDRVVSVKHGERRKKIGLVLPPCFQNCCSGTICYK
jgi:hypothetical protein